MKAAGFNPDPLTLTPQQAAPGYAVDPALGGVPCLFARLELYPFNPEADFGIAVQTSTKVSSMVSVQGRAALLN